MLRGNDIKGRFKTFYETIKFENQVLWACIPCFTAERINMITKIRLPQTLIPVSIVAITLLAAVLLFPAVNFASAEPGKPAPKKQKENHNRLINESSPYLLQHATNPIDWFPWGTEAFDKAKREDKPIFLSIGYSTCHWCHVMAHESFADNEVAGFLNKDFISIKVDREERPDIDHVYMTVTQALTGSGGWPMTIIMTPDKKPFYAGTYFPKNSRWGRPGLMELLPKIAEVWQNDRNKVNDSADRITRHVLLLGDSRPGSNLDRQILDQARAFFVQAYDSEHGGFGESPKFPSPHQLSFLLRRYHHTQNEQTLAMVEKTLTQMRLGGINDYAFMVWGLLELYQATFEIKYLKDAIELNQQMLSHFWDEEKGGLYMTADDSEKLLVRSKVIYDGAIPSGNSVAVFNLLRLGHMTGKADYLTKAERIIKSFSAEVELHPAGHCQLMVALEFALNPNYEVVIVGKPQKKDTMMMLVALGKPFLPEKVALFRPADLEAAAEVTRIAPFTLPMAAKNGRATAYVCREFACKLPTTRIDQMLENLRQN